MGILGFLKRKGASLKDHEATTNTMKEMRENVFSLNPNSIGVAKSQSLPDVWAGLLEIGFPDAVASAICIADGTTSLYFSSGGGIIGGGAHEAVKQANQAFLVEGQRCLPRMSIQSHHPGPKPGQVLVYLLAYSGLYCAEAQENDLENGVHPLLPLFSLGNEVITQLRLTSEGTTKA